MKQKLTACTGVNDSLNTAISNTKLTVGDKYWMKPIVESGNRFAAWANQYSGMAVAAPDNDSSPH